MRKSMLMLLVLSVLARSRAAPATYDQRQDGGLNVKVDLDNFVILVARPSSALDIFGSMAQLLSEAKNSGAQESKSAADDEGAKLTEVKDLADVSMEPAAKPAAEEKPILIVQQGDQAMRSIEEVARTLRNFRGNEAMLVKDKTKGVSSGKYKFVESVDEPQSLKLIGDALENCGPGRSRDRMGICQGDGLATGRESARATAD